MNAKRFVRAITTSFIVFLFPTLPVISQVENQSQPPTIIRKSGGVLQGSATKRSEPVYPPLAKAALISGSVVVEVTVDEEGKVIAAHAISGHPLLKDAAVSAARLWQFSPTVLSGTPVKVIGTLTFNFGLDAAAERARQRHGDAEQEIKDARVAVDANPGSAEAHFELGEAYADAKRYEEAIESFKQAILLKPDSENAHSALAGAYYELERYDEEILAYKNALTVIPNSTVCLEGLAWILGNRGRFSEAIEVQKRLIELRPDDARALGRLGFLLHSARRYDEAIAAYKETLVRRPNDATALYNLGAAYATLGRLEQALAAFQQSLEVKPPYDKPGRAYREIALVLTRLDRTSEAIEAGRKAIETDPTLIDAYCTLARSYRESGRYQESLDVLKTGLQVKPLDEALELSLGDTYFKLANMPEAEKAYREVLRVSSNSPNALVGLGMVLTNQNKFSEAEAVIRKAVTLFPRHTNAHVVLGNLLAQEGKTAEAEKEYRSALEIEPNNHLVLNNLGYAMVERGEKLEEALKMIQRAVEAEPGNGFYLDSLGLAFVKLGRFAEAESPLLEAARQFPAISTVHEHLGDLYAGQGKPDQSRAAWQKALTLSTEPNEAARLKKKLAGETKK